MEFKLHTFVGLNGTKSTKFFEIDFAFFYNILEVTLSPIFIAKIITTAHQNLHLGILEVLRLPWTCVQNIWDLSEQI